MVVHQNNISEKSWWWARNAPKTPSMSKTSFCKRTKILKTLMLQAQNSLQPHCKWRRTKSKYSLKTTDRTMVNILYNLGFKANENWFDKEITLWFADLIQYVQAVMLDIDLKQKPFMILFLHRLQGGRVCWQLWVSGWPGLARQVSQKWGTPLMTLTRFPVTSCIFKDKVRQRSV